jgi:hypothetical protein
MSGLRGSGFHELDTPELEIKTAPMPMRTHAATRTAIQQAATGVSVDCR